MADDKTKDIPTLEDVIHPGDLDKAVVGDLTPEAGENTDEPAGDEAAAGDEHDERRAGERRTAERRVSKQPLPEDQVERRVSERRRSQRRDSDKQRSQNLDQLVENIMNDMLPDLEQHIRLQLRFELEKHLPRGAFEQKDADTDPAD